METVGGNVDWPCPCEAKKHARGNVFFCRLNVFVRSAVVLISKIDQM
jgi:hypothetical protein